MAGLLDIFVKIIIAILGFIAPTITVLIPFLEKGGSKTEENLKEEKEKLDEIIKRYDGQIDKNIQDNIKRLADRGGAGRQNLDDLNNETAILEKDKKDTVILFTKRINHLEEQLYYLNLKHQVLAVFISLITSLVSVMVYHLIKSDIFDCFGIPQFYVMLPFVVICYAYSFFTHPKRLCTYRINLHKNHSLPILTIAFLPWASSFIILVAALAQKFDWYRFITIPPLILTHKILLSLFFLLISLIFLLYALQSLYNIVLTMIDTKKLLEAPGGRNNGPGRDPTPENPTPDPIKGSDADTTEKSV